MCRRIIISLILAGWIRTVSAYENELRFIEELTADGFPDLAETVLSRTLKEFPEAQPHASQLQIRILIAQKDFSAAQKRMVELENAQSLQLLLAETAYTARQTDVAEKAYAKYFASLTEADQSTACAAFNYGQLLEERGAYADAKTVYERAIGFSGFDASIRPI
jgi:tetratricopeptide (TPR) repeat protein